MSNWKSSLTSTEQTAAEMYYNGCTDKEIADTIYVAEGTVKTIMEKIFKKAGLQRSNLTSYRKKFIEFRKVWEQ